MRILSKWTTHSRRYTDEVHMKLTTAAKRLKEESVTPALLYIYTFLGVLEDATAYTAPCTGIHTLHFLSFCLITATNLSVHVWDIWAWSNLGLSRFCTLKYERRFGICVHPPFTRIFPNNIQHNQLASFDFQYKFSCSVMYN